MISFFFFFCSFHFFSFSVSHARFTYIQTFPTHHDMNSCDDERPFSFLYFFFFLIVTVLLFYTNFIFCWLSDIDLMKWPREHHIYKTQLLSFNIIDCFSLILATPFLFCLLVCLFVLC
jgi:hypothetical protein